MDQDDAASTERDPLDLLVEEFTARLRAGESVAIPAFAAAHPAHEAELLELLPTLQALEQLKRERETTDGLTARVALPELHRLGDFRIVREVGRGGMGVVFEAFQESLSRKVALKVLPQAALLTGNQLRRFQREAQIAAKLHHSNIVPVFGSGETDGYHWYAMQFIDGDGLDAWRRQELERQQGGSAIWRDRARFVAGVGEQVASALQYAHGQGTLHRDIKPANLLLDRDGHVWITDFGLAKALEAEGLTHSGDLLGTLQYMAPEQFHGHYDAASEVYALGITLWELLTLQPAFAGRTKSELMDAIRRGRPPSMRRLCPDAPADLLTVIEKATASEPADRYPDAEALQHDLQAFLEDRAISARRQSLAGNVLRWCRRNRATAALLLATVVAVLVAGITGWVAYVTTDDALARAKTAGEATKLESRRAEANLRLSLTAFADVFDALVGPDPLLMFEEDPDTGEEYVVAPRTVGDEDVALLAKMLRFYDEFAAQNAGSQNLRFETARAYRRVGLIQARLGKLDEAAAAYDQALERYADVTDRDVTRELAAVHMEYGQVEQRRHDARAAAGRFRLAIELLDREPAVGDTAALRFDRANVHYLIAHNAVARGRERGGWRPERRERAEQARSELDAAQAILATLSDADVKNRDVRALEARCLLLAGRLPADDEDKRAADVERGIAILTELVAEDPGAPQFRLALCEALRDGPRRQDLDERIARLEAAEAQANVLVGQQPGVADYRGMRGSIADELGLALLQRARTAEGAARRDALARAEVELRIAIVDPNPRSVLAMGRLDSLLRATDRAAEADAELDRFFGALQQELARRPLDRRRAGRFLPGRDRQPGRDRRPPRPDGPGGGPGNGLGAGGLFGFTPEFEARVREVRDQLPPPEPDRQDAGPPEQDPATDRGR
ncbi:MAG: serine/threonine protein kinase [Planctomycetes bacterium]|nr:serine/threonine protein kinase [Planctomycetota bacterium]